MSAFSILIANFISEDAAIELSVHNLYYIINILTLVSLQKFAAF
jgi:hypothetical protein